MLVNQQVLDLAFKGFKTVVTDAMLEAKAYADQVAMTVPSASRDETYGWLGSFPAMREWLGPRNVKNLVANGFTIQNRKPGRSGTRGGLRCLPLSFSMNGAMRSL